jgi:hypothetical protein
VYPVADFHGLFQGLFPKGGVIHTPRPHWRCPWHFTLYKRCFLISWSTFKDVFCKYDRAHTYCAPSKSASDIQACMFVTKPKYP